MLPVKITGSMIWVGFFSDLIQLTPLGFLLFGEREGWGGEIEKDRQTDRQRQRDKDRDRDTETKRQRHRETQRDRERQRRGGEL